MMKNDWISLINWAREWADDQDEELELIESIVKVKNQMQMSNKEIFHLWDCLGCMERSLAAHRLYRQLEAWG